MVCTGLGGSSSDNAPQLEPGQSQGVENETVVAQAPAAVPAAKDEQPAVRKHGCAVACPLRHAAASCGGVNNKYL